MSNTRKRDFCLLTDRQKRRIILKDLVSSRSQLLLINASDNKVIENTQVAPTLLDQDLSYSENSRFGAGNNDEGNIAVSSHEANESKDFGVSVPGVFLQDTDSSNFIQGPPSSSPSFTVTDCESDKVEATNC